LVQAQEGAHLISIKKPFILEGFFVVFCLEDGCCLLSYRVFFFSLLALYDKKKPPILMRE
jgi:hypothetical protein